MSPNACSLGDGLCQLFCPPPVFNSTDSYSTGKATICPTLNLHGPFGYTHSSIWVLKEGLWERVSGWVQILYMATVHWILSCHAYACWPYTCLKILVIFSFTHVLLPPLPQNESGCRFLFSSKSLPIFRFQLLRFLCILRSVIKNKNKTRCDCIGYLDGSNIILQQSLSKMEVKVSLRYF